MTISSDKIKELLGQDIEYLLGHQSKTIEKGQMHLPSPDVVDQIFVNSNRNPQVLRSLSALFNHHIGVLLQADIIKQKLPTNNGGFTAVKFGKSHQAMYDKLSSDHPIDLCRYQLVNCYMGRIGLINSGGESLGEGDFSEAVKTAVINKRAGGMGLILGRKAFQRPFEEGVNLLNLVQEVYLSKEIDLA
jgi:class I fructose-bisphosphate aldolase